MASANSITACRRTGFAWYWPLVVAQSLGAIVVLINGVPIYRQMAGHFAGHAPKQGILWWAVAGVLLIQVPYWLRVHWQPDLPQGGNVLLAHLVLFVARLSFILASSTFTVIFLVRFEELSLPPNRVLMLLALVFSLFCFTLELERLGKALNEPAETFKRQKSNL